MATDDTAETIHVDDSVTLTKVPSGKMCKLIGITRHGRRVHRQREGHAKFLVKDYPETQLHEPKHHGNRRIMRRLLDLGITTGCVFEVIQSGMSGPVLIQVRGTRVALGYGLASKILVRVVDE